VKGERVVGDRRGKAWGQEEGDSMRGRWVIEERGWVRGRVGKRASPFRTLSLGAWEEGVVISPSELAPERGTDQVGSRTYPHILPFESTFDRCGKRMPKRRISGKEIVWGEGRRLLPKSISKESMGDCCNQLLMGLQAHVCAKGARGNWGRSGKRGFSTLGTFSVAGPRIQ